MNRCIAFLLLATPTMAIPVSTTLSLVTDDPGFNALSVTIDPDTPFPLSDTETAILNGTTREFTIREGRAGASTVIFERSFIGIGYSVTANELSAALATTNPPGSVDPLSGDFDASQHSFEIDQGSVTGSALGNPVNVNPSPSEPLVGSGRGTGNVSLTPNGFSGIYRQFDVTVTLPVSLADSFDGGGINVDISAEGTIKATGTLQVPRSEYLAWTIDQGIAGADGQADANGDNIPNAIAWALGLGSSEDARSHFLRPTSSGYEIQLPAAGTLAPITIQGSDLSSAWTPIPSTRVSSAFNPLPPGSTGLIAISRSTDEFLRLKVDE